jgi:hypothetical protein
MNFATTPLRRLFLDSDASSVYLKLGDLEPNVQVTVRGDESSLKLRLPEGIGLRFIGEDYSRYLDRIGLIEDNNGFITEGFDSSRTKVELDLDDRLSSFSVDFF